MSAKFQPSLEAGRIYLILEAGALRNGVAEGAMNAAYVLRCPHKIKSVPGWEGELTDPGCVGVVSRCWDAQPFNELLQKPFPVINVSNLSGPVKGAGNFLSDDRAVGRMAAKHLLAQGYRKFFAVGSATAYSLERLEGFEAALHGEGYSMKKLVYSPGSGTAENGNALRSFIETMPPDCAVFATNDYDGWQILETLERNFPNHLDTMGVLGVDNSQEAGYWYPGPLPGLSSVLPGFESIGWAAIEWLCNHSGRGAKKETAKQLRRFPPVRVVARGSTACGGCAHPITARMARWVWSRVQNGETVSVEEIAAHHRMSRKTAYRLFTGHTGKSPVDFIANLRMDLARNLLKTTNLPIAEISERCGFSKNSVLSTALGRIEGCTPREYRQKMLHG